MLARLLAAQPEAALVSAVAERSDGIPFAVEELALALDEAGRLTHRRSAVGLIGGGSDGPTPVPAGIREAVLLRTTRLPDPARWVLDVAAAAGTDFDVDLTPAVAGVPAWPEELSGSGLVTPVVDGRAAFRHALTRDAVHADIPWSRRRELHRALADRLAAAGAAPDSRTRAEAVRRLAELHGDAGGLP
jgi:hypothetical protein